ncbi:hypothetical protein C8J56DRAFT_1069441 [Mycena floridula]|nr:hypothetical protein C8J56DRAFT_1069441 [Mycena floridula]
MVLVPRRNPIRAVKRTERWPASIFNPLAPILSMANDIAARIKKLRKSPLKFAANAVEAKAKIVIQAEKEAQRELDAMRQELEDLRLMVGTHCNAMTGFGDRSLLPQPRWVIPRDDSNREIIELLCSELLSAAQWEPDDDDVTSIYLTPYWQGSLDEESD